MKTSFGDMDIDIPRDRNGEFEPQLVKKGDIEKKIIFMYAKGMTGNDISAHIEDIYGIDVSDSTISRITDKILPVANEPINSERLSNMQENTDLLVSFYKYYASWIYQNYSSILTFCEDWAKHLKIQRIQADKP